MKNKILTFLCIIAFLVLGAINKLIPVKCADNIQDTYMQYQYNTYYVFGLDRIDADAIQGHQWKIAKVFIPNSQQWGDFYLTAYLISEGSNAYTINIESSSDISGLNVIENYTFSVSGYNEDSVRQHVLVIYNQFFTNSLQCMYISVVNCSQNYNNFIDQIYTYNTYSYQYNGSITNPQINFSQYNYLFNDYMETDELNVYDVLEDLTERINYFYVNSPYYGKLIEVYRDGVSVGQATPITRDWISTIFDKITTFLNIQILPNLTFGTLLAIPLVLCLVKLVLFIWRNEG